MDNQTHIFEWGADCLASYGYSITQKPEVVLSTPWSSMIRFSTLNGDFYLKQTPPAISREPEIIQLLSDRFHANVPSVIAINHDLSCFMMRDAGKTLRVNLKNKFNVDLLCQMIKEYSTLQRSTEANLEEFLKLGVPDWRLDKLPILYDQILSQKDFLKADNMTDQELQILHDLRPQFLAQCELLASYEIPATIGIPDFNDNNTLFNTNTGVMTFIDWGEATITHPFFSLYNCLDQAVKRHGVQEADRTYNELVDACHENWLGFLTKEKVLEVFNLVMQLRAIYSALGCQRLMMSVDLQALNDLYANTQPNRLALAFRKYIDSCGMING